MHRCTLAHLHSCSDGHTPSRDIAHRRIIAVDHIGWCTHYYGMTEHTPPTIIAFASPKGGAGKSTTCLSIAGALAASGQSVHIIDCDPSETLYRWYTANDSAQTIANLSVEAAPSGDIIELIKEIWYRRQGIVLIDLPGTFDKKMINLAIIAAMTITPAKLSEPDIIEANKLYTELKALGERIGKKVNHRILINEVPSLLANFQVDLLDQLRGTDLPRLDTIIHYRAAYPETFQTGRPPHFAVDQTRPTIAKAKEELEAVVNEIANLIEGEEQKAAA